jgi:2-hydroxychromene-2-carboxylate isomerase
MTKVLFYLDFISPYTWLALMCSHDFADENGVDFELHPVVYAAMLDAHGLVGPAETVAKRRYTFHDVVRLARTHGLKFAGPPAHPFRSLEALRTQFLFREHQQALELAARLANACWGEGRDLTDPDVRRDVVDAVGLDSSDLEERISTPGVKQGLRAMTEKAIADGVFGVPTFLHGKEMFWGHDRLDQLAVSLSRKTSGANPAADTFLRRPRGVDRPGAPKS